MSSGIGAILEWDSDFFGLRIGRLHGPESLKADWRAWADAQEIACFYLLVPADDAPGLAAAADCGFQDVDERVTFTMELDRYDGASADAIEIRNAVLADQAALESIAAISHQSTRFYADPHFSDGDCARLYATWIAISLREETVITAIDNGEPVGYVSVRVEGDTGHIGLLGVAESARGKGIGAALVHAAARYFKEHGCLSAQVVTQGRNKAAMRLYERAGFRVCQREHWFHWWRD